MNAYMKIALAGERERESTAWIAETYLPLRTQNEYPLTIVVESYGAWWVSEVINYKCHTVKLSQLIVGNPKIGPIEGEEQGFGQLGLG